MCFILNIDGQLGGIHHGGVHKIGGVGNGQGEQIINNARHAVQLVDGQGNGSFPFLVARVVE